MGKIINLRQARKAKGRAAKRARGDANAVAFGTPKAERERLEAEQARETQRIEGHRRDGAQDPADE